LDAAKPGLHGGTGQTFRWDLALKAQSLGRPILLAGGLTPDNVAEAIRQAQPWAVDVASGVESSPGKKDAKLVQAFVKAAKHAQSCLACECAKLDSNEERALAEEGYKGKVTKPIY
jgi:phosphoribosylanthranilate isomerase